MMMLFVGGPLDGAFHTVEDRGTREVRVKAPDGVAFYAIDTDGYREAQHSRGIAHFVRYGESADSLIDIFEVS